jgi:hypothetical protein
MAKENNNTAAGNDATINTELQIPVQSTPLNTSIGLPSQNKNETLTTQSSTINQQVNIGADGLGGVESRSFDISTIQQNSSAVRYTTNNTNAVNTASQSVQLVPVKDAILPNVYHADLTGLIRSVKKNSLLTTDQVKDFLNANPPNIKVTGYNVSNVRVEFDNKTNKPSLRFTATPSLSQELNTGLTYKHSDTPYANKGAYGMIEFKTTFGGPGANEWSLGLRGGVQSGRSDTSAYATISNPKAVTNPTIDGVTITIPQNFQSQQQTRANVHTVRP